MAKNGERIKSAIDYMKSHPDDIVIIPVDGDPYSPNSDAVPAPPVAPSDELRSLLDNGVHFAKQSIGAHPHLSQWVKDVEQFLAKLE